MGTHTKTLALLMAAILGTGLAACQRSGENKTAGSAMDSQSSAPTSNANQPPQQGFAGSSNQPSTSDQSGSMGSSANQSTGNAAGGTSGSSGSGSGMSGSSGGSSSGTSGGTSGGSSGGTSGGQ